MVFIRCKIKDSSLLISLDFEVILASILEIWDIERKDCRLFIESCLGLLELNPTRLGPIFKEASPG